MKKNILFFALFLFCINGFSIISDKKNAWKGNCFFITAKSGLNIRSSPNLRSVVLFSLPEGELVFYQGKLKPAIVAGRSGNWMLVKWKKKQGWAFSSYLEHSPEFDKKTQYDGYTLILFYAFNRKTKKAEIRLNTQLQEINGFTPELRYKNGRILAECVRPVVEHLRFIIYGKSVTKQLFQKLKAKKPIHLHAIVQQFTLNRKHVRATGGGYYERHFTIKLRVTKFTMLKSKKP